LMNKGDKWSSNVRGDGGFHGLSTAWLCLAEFRPELYKLIAERSMNSPDPRLVRILKWKNDHGKPAQQAMK